MKRILTYILLLPLVATAQRIPQVNFNRITLSQEDKTVKAIVADAGVSVKTVPALSYYWYQANVIHITQGGFSGKLLDGPYAEFFLDKSLKLQGNFEKGLKDGEWKEWNEGGILLSSFTWKNGIMNGPFTVYKKGLPETAGAYRNGRLNGLVTNYLGGDSVQTAKYKDGKLMAIKRDKSSLWRRLIFFKKKKASKDSAKVQL